MTRSPPDYSRDAHTKVWLDNQRSLDDTGNTKDRPPSPLPTHISVLGVTI